MFFCIYLIFISLLFFTSQHNVALSTPLVKRCKLANFHGKIMYFFN